MIVTGIRTHKITSRDKDILKILDKYIRNLKENSIIAVTSKIISIAEGRIVKLEGVDKDELIKKESQLYLPRSESKYDVSLTVTRGILMATAGIDESNSDGNYVLWPEDPQDSANQIRKFLRKKFGIKNLGVIITDSRTTPMRWGVTAIAIAYSGFEPLKSYIGEKDLFGREFVFEKLNIADSLATAAILEMGEGAEQKPIAVIEDIRGIEFRQSDPSKKELKEMEITFENDFYGPFLKKAPWEKGRGK